MCDRNNMAAGIIFPDRRTKAPVPSEQNKFGLTDGEQSVMERLMDAHGEFLALDREHPEEMREFVDAIHRMQDLLAMRAIRRCYPEGWPTYDLDKIWLVGQFREETQAGIIWDIQGVFADKDKAIEACRNENYFIAPLRINEALPDKATEWPGLEYPLAK